MPVPATVRHCVRRVGWRVSAGVRPTDRFSGELLVGQTSAGDTVGDIRQQQRKGVLGLVELLLQIEQSRTYIIIGSFGLRQGSFGHHSRCFHGTGGGDALFPGSFRSGGDFDLGVEPINKVK